MMSILLKNQVAEDLHVALAGEGVTLRMARQIQVSVTRRNAFPEPAAGGLSAQTVKRVQERTAIPDLELVDKIVSPKDGFAKYLFRGDGEGSFEAVRIPLLHRPDDPKYVVCVSSQVGCAMGCEFCATGRMGFVRNLAAWEIVDQVIKIQADSEFAVRSVVFMGMGEPLLNYDSVITAARMFSEPCGLAIAAKSITICTAGIVPGIRRFTAEGHAFRLLVSLTSADVERRSELMPVEKKYPTPQLMDAIRDYHEATGQRVTFAWTMISGVNTCEEDAKALAALTKGLPIKLDLIDVNDATGRFTPPSEDELNAFRDALRKHLGMPVVRRYSGGQDIQAACGMLASRA